MMVSRVIEKTCPNCGKVKSLPYKRRDCPGFCNLACAYAYRVILPVLEKQCLVCGSTYQTKNLEQKYCSNQCKADGFVGYRHTSQARAAMSNQRSRFKISRIKRDCKGCGTAFTIKTIGKGSGKRYCSVHCRMLHDNPINDPVCRAGTLDVLRNKSDATRSRISVGMSKAWREGKFEGVRVGQSYWYEYRHGDKSWKVQGTWELAFIDWMVTQTSIRFECHRGFIPYETKIGRKRYWYPDFYVYDWDSWVDVKCRHFYKPSKFNDIRRSNPGLSVRLLFLEDLAELGVKIYAKGNAYCQHLQDLIQGCRVQPGVGNLFA